MWKVDYDKRIRALKADLFRKEAKLERVKADARFLLQFVPNWAENMLKGLDPTFYGTLTYEGDMEIKTRIDSIRALLEKSDDH